MKNKKIIFWAVDCQKDFIEPPGALYVEGAETIKPNLKKLTEFAKENNIFVVNTADYHFPDDKELSEALAEIEHESAMVRILGSYPKAVLK